MPHKEAALALVERVSDEARRIGAVNTIVVGADGLLEGSNTDGYGFLAHLKAAAPLWRAKNGAAVILGAGGAARAIAVALLDAGMGEVRLVNRTLARAQALAAEFGKGVKAIDWAERSAALKDAGLLVNSTTLGMSGQPALEIDLKRLPATAVVYDIVYVPLETRLLAAARRRGHVARRRARHAAASGRARLCRLVRHHAGGDAGIARIRSRCLMKILCLTGSVGMGKTTAARMLRRLGIPVHDADGEVHRLLGRGGAAVRAVDAAFPGVKSGKAIDRAVLGKIVFADKTALKRLEAILHPLVRQAERRFLAEARREHRRLVVLDIPLLFETKGERRCDGVIVVSAPRSIQRARVLARPGMTKERLAAIEARQMPDREKRRRADIVIETGLGKRHSLAALRRAIARFR